MIKITQIAVAHFGNRRYVMAWRYTQAGKEMRCPSSEDGVYVEGPLRVADWKNILEDIVAEMVEQAKREAEETR
jgi:hypothetical protein